MISFWYEVKHFFRRFKPSNIKQFVGRKFKDKKSDVINDLKLQNSELSSKNNELKKICDNLRDVVSKSRLELINYHDRNQYDDYIASLLMKESLKFSLSNINKIENVTEDFMDIMMVMDKFDIKFLEGFIYSQKSSTIAVILIHLYPIQSAKILDNMDAELQCNVAAHMILTDKFSMEVINELEQLLNITIPGYFMIRNFQKEDPLEYFNKVLEFVSRSTERNILDSIEQKDHELFSRLYDIRYSFENILLLDNRSMQTLLRQDIDNRELAIALKGTNQEIQDKIFSNLSKRLAAMIKEDMEFMGPVRKSDAKEAQCKIVNIMRRLCDSGEILLPRYREELIN